MARPACRVLTLALGLAALCESAAAQEAGVSAKLHPWGIFSPGAWKTVRVVTETLDEQGGVIGTTTTDTKTALVAVGSQCVTLEIQACMEVAGKRFEAESQTVRQGFCGELLGPDLKLHKPVEAEVTIEGQKIACKSQRLESAAANGKTVTTIYYSTTVAPYILKRESATTDSEGNKVSETNVETLSLNMPVTIQGEIKNGVYVKSVLRNPNGTVTTLAVVLPEVPGGVVSNSSKEVDKAGRLVRRSILELRDYNSDPEKDRSGMFGRKRPARRTKQPPRYGQ